MNATGNKKTKASDESGDECAALVRVRQTLSLYFVVLVVLFLAILSGALDSLLIPIYESIYGPTSETGLQDLRMVSVLLLFSLSFAGMVLGVLEKEPNRLLLVGAITALFITHLGYLIKGFPEGQLNFKTLYMALAVFIALMLPIAMSDVSAREVRLRHVYATFGVALLVSCVVGLFVLGLVQLFWPDTEFAKISRTMRFVITPMAVVIVTVSWGTMACYRLFPQWSISMTGSYWLLTYLVFALLLSFFYGWIFFQSKEWVIVANISQWKAALAAQALLLPGIFVLGICLQSGLYPVGILRWLRLAALCALVQSLSAGWVATLLEAGSGPAYPYLRGSDWLPFVLTHAFAASIAILVLPLVLTIMKGYPWPSWHWIAKILK